MSYYVYGTFVERERFKFETKEEALAFRKWANEKVDTSFDWVIHNPDPHEAQEYGFDQSRLYKNQGYWQCINHEYRASFTKSISKPIKSHSFWNRLKNQFWFIVGINKIDHWTRDVPIQDDEY